MAAGLRYTAGGSLTGFVTGLRDGEGIFGTVREGAAGLTGGWKDGLTAFSDAVKGGDPALTATRWQSGLAYPGKDMWSNIALPAGTKAEVLNPGITGFATPGGTASSLGHDATQINQGVQVGASKISGTILHNYRPSVVTLRLNTDMNAATSITRANPQYGAGGIRQYFIPDIADAIKTGNISVIGADGSELPVHIVDGTRVIIDAAPGQLIQLHNLDLTASSRVFTQNQFQGGMTSLSNIRMVTTAAAREHSAANG